MKKKQKIKTANNFLDLKAQAFAVAHELVQIAIASELEQRGLFRFLKWMNAYMKDLT